MLPFISASVLSLDGNYFFGVVFVEPIPISYVRVYVW